MLNVKNVVNKIRRLLNYDLDKTTEELNHISRELYDLKQNVNDVDCFNAKEQHYIKNRDIKISILCSLIKVYSRKVNRQEEVI